MANLDNIQGDVFSRGFPKMNETYYFFSITEGKENGFTKALSRLATSGHISTLTNAISQWGLIDQLKADQKGQVNTDSPKDILPVANALIAFTMSGLDRIQIGLASANPPRDLSLGLIKTSDRTFFFGMADDKDALNDPPANDWEPPFQRKTSTPNTIPIHGVIKVAGSDPKIVNDKLLGIQIALQRGTKGALIQDLPGSGKSKIDGQVRPEAKKLNGREHFGFEDAISQPLLDGIDKQETIRADPAMKTSQNVITIVEPERKEKTRPSWMKDGSFFVFRKLEQDVSTFDKFCNDIWQSVGYDSAEQCGAKLMGRWKNGTPISESPNKEDPVVPRDPVTGDRKPTNDFTFANSLCPFGAHIRKTNPRSKDEDDKLKRIVRNGIPYGNEIIDDPKGKRGLLFACYQSDIEQGFQFIQQQWANRVTFPSIPSPNKGVQAGFDPIIGQAPAPKANSPPPPPFHTTLFNVHDKPVPIPLAKFVTMRGGEYFFVPSISALKDKLGSPS